jgi:uncharacterized membrane protein
LLLAGLGSGTVIASNQDFVLARVPSQEAGTASAILSTAQRAGSAIGIAVRPTLMVGGAITALTTLISLLPGVEDPTLQHPETPTPQPRRM